ncbi:Zn-ribbon domain-containing OB-fold protein [Natrinema gelatinilyticum]|uniref:Zn-ribbon domain-containing OB-fold protein n=1 Tax=Natrinema gelatinilyticum TaxID=2961571 RepID=UPI0020C1D457|nr:OB-fold domain-containing protein [Natrinema gelatinilyticum]
MTRDVPIDHAFTCESCGDCWYYTRGRCPTCRSEAVDTYRIRRGEVVSATTVHATLPGVRSPSRLGLVRFDYGVTLVAQLDDDSSAGDTVRFGAVAVLRDGERAVSGPRLSSFE